MRALQRVPPRYRAMLVLMMFQSMMHLGSTTGLNVALPAMVEDFDASLPLVAWIQIAYGVGLIGTVLPSGLLISHFDPRKVIMVGIVSEVVLSLAIAMTANIYVVIIMRALQSSLRSLPWLALQMLSIGEFRSEHRGRVLGITTFAVGMSMLISTPLVGFVTDHWGWRWVFVGTSGGMGLVGVISMIWLRFPQEERPPVRERLAGFDVMGSALLMVGTIGLIFALQMVIRISVIGGLGVGLAAVVTLFFAVRVELAHRSPVIPLRILRVRGVFLGASQSVLIGWITGSFLLLLPILFVNGYGWSATYAGSILFFISVTRPGGNLASGWLSDRFGSVRVLVPAAVVLTAGQLLVAFLDTPPVLSVVISGLVIVGFAQAVGQTANLRQMYTSVPQGSLRLAPGLNAVLMSIGNTSGQAVVASSLAAVAVASVPATDLADVAAKTIVMTTAAFAVGLMFTQVASRFFKTTVETKAGSGLESS